MAEDRQLWGVPSRQPTVKELLETNRLMSLEYNELVEELKKEKAKNEGLVTAAKEAAAALAEQVATKRSLLLHIEDMAVDAHKQQEELLALEHIISHLPAEEWNKAELAARGLTSLRPRR
jgi:hypothetical protein